jgi:hypothetical protein
MIHRPQMDVDDHCYGLSADDPQSRLLSHTRASDDRFQSAVAKRLASASFSTRADA